MAELCFGLEPVLVMFSVFLLSPASKILSRLFKQVLCWIRIWLDGGPRIGTGTVKAGGLQSIIHCKTIPNLFFFATD